MKNILILCVLLTSCNNTYEVKVWRGGVGRIQHYDVNLSPDQMLAQFQNSNFDSVRITGTIDTTIILK